MELESLIKSEGYENIKTRGSSSYIFSFKILKDSVRGHMDLFQTKKMYYLIGFVYACNLFCLHITIILLYVAGIGSCISMY